MCAPYLPRMTKPPHNRSGTAPLSLLAKMCLIVLSVLSASPCSAQQLGATGAAATRSSAHRAGRPSGESGARTAGTRAQSSAARVRCCGIRRRRGRRSSVDWPGDGSVQRAVGHHPEVQGERDYRVALGRSGIIVMACTHSHTVMATPTRWKRLTHKWEYAKPSAHACFPCFVRAVLLLLLFARRKHTSVSTELCGPCRSVITRSARSVNKRAQRSFR